MSVTGMLPYWPLSQEGVRDARKINADLLALVTGIEAISTGTTGLQGATGIAGVTGPDLILQETSFPTGVQVPIVLWNMADEALYAYVTGVDRWVQISAGSVGGTTGPAGTTGLANFIQDGFPTGMEVPCLLWNFTDEALYAYLTGVDRWVQISAGSMQGATGQDGLANWKQETDFPTGMVVPHLLWNFVDEALYAYCTGVDRWVQISAGSAAGATGLAGATGPYGTIGPMEGQMEYVSGNFVTGVPLYFYLTGSNQVGTRILYNHDAGMLWTGFVGSNSGEVKITSYFNDFAMDSGQWQSYHDHFPENIYEWTRKNWLSYAITGTNWSCTTKYEVAAGGAGYTGFVWGRHSAVAMEGAIGATGLGGLANWIQESDFPTGTSVPILLWNFVDEALYAYCTGVDRWVQISAGSQSGASGTQGVTGLANWMEESTFPTGMATPVLLWNQVDEALYAYCTGPDRWVQISAGSAAGGTGLQGCTGVQGQTGAQGYTGTDGSDGGVTGIITVVINGGEAIAPTGQVADFVLPVDLEFYNWTMTCEPTGTVWTDLQVATYANAPPTTADSICGGTGPWIEAGIKNNASDAGWTGSAGWTGTAGTIMRVVMRGNDLAKMACMNLVYRRL